MKIKFIILGSLFSAFCVVIIAVLFKIQVIEQSFYQKKVEDIALRQNALKSLRGRIFDSNNDVPLAYNISAYQVILSNKNLEVVKENIQHIANILDISKSQLDDFIKKAQSTKEEVIIKDNLLFDEILPYLDDINNISELSWKRSILRKYTYADSMAHIIGYVGSISPDELQTLAYNDYDNKDIIGKFGVEKQYEEFLRGKTGTKEEVVNVRGESVNDKDTIIKQIKPGYDLVLTIDRHIQQIVEQALGPRIGAVLVLRPTTGEIVAMASYPSYNPNLLVHNVNSKLIEELQNNTNSPFLNRTIQASSTPASTFKVLMATAFLDLDREKKLGYWNHNVYDPGYLRIGNRIFRCWYLKGHGYTDYIKALEESCNVFFYSIGTEILGVSNIYKYASVFGLGQLSGIDLPGEVAGVVPSPKWKLATYLSEWTLGDTANMSIGQAYVEVTPLQMALVIAGIVNEGVVYKPHVLKYAKDQITGKEIYRTPIEVLRTLDIDSTVLVAIKKALRSVAVKGTSAVLMKNNHVQIAGKTGSAQIEGDNFKSLHSWYVSFGPYDAPPEEQLVVVTWIDAKNQWEWWAPKATSIIYEAIFTNKSFEDAAKAVYINPTPPPPPETL